MTRSCALLMCILAASPTWAAPEDILARKVSIRLQDADGTAVAAQITAAVGQDVDVDKALPPARHSLSVEGVPLRDLLDAIGNLYEAQWLFRDGKILLRPDPLRRPISLELKDAPLPMAVAAFMDAAHAKAPFEAMASSRRVTLTVKDVPARDVGAALMALYGLQRQHAGPGQAPPPAVPAAAGGTVGLAASLAKLIAPPGPSEQGNPVVAVGGAFLSSFTREDFNAMVPGEKISVDALGHRARALALEAAQLTALSSIAGVLKQHPNYLDPAAAATGEGLVYGRTKDGNWLGLWMPSAGGTMARIMAQQMVPHTPPPTD